jgi:hypothetical protein
MSGATLNVGNDPTGTPHRRRTTTADTTDTGAAWQQPRIYPNARYARSQKQWGQRAGQTITVPRRMGPLRNNLANRVRLGDAQVYGSARDR